MPPGREIYDNLTAWQRVQIARHVQRPFALDYIERCFADWIELHGDRLFAEDKAMPSGLARLGSHRCVVHHSPKGTQHQRKCDAQFRLRPSRGLSQSTSADAAGGKIRDAGSFADRYARRVSGGWLGRTAHRRSDCGQSPGDDAVACSHHRCRHRRRRFGRRPRNRGGRPGHDSRERLLFGDQSRGLFGHFVAGPATRS